MIFSNPLILGLLNIDLYSKSHSKKALLSLNIVLLSLVLKGHDMQTIKLTLIQESFHNQINSFISDYPYSNGIAMTRLPFSITYN